ncbi:hypothetical protein Tco_1458691 [Tanacetum coccineum]
MAQQAIWFNPRNLSVEHVPPSKSIVLIIAIVGNGIGLILTISIKGYSALVEASADLQNCLIKETRTSGFLYLQPGFYGSGSLAPRLSLLVSDMGSTTFLASEVHDHCGAAILCCSMEVTVYSFLFSYPQLEFSMSADLFVPSTLLPFQ